MSNFVFKSTVTGVLPHTLLGVHASDLLYRFNLFRLLGYIDVVH